MLLLPQAVLSPGPCCHPESRSSRIHGQQPHPHSRPWPPPQRPHSHSHRHGHSHRRIDPATASARKGEAGRSLGRERGRPLVTSARKGEAGRNLGRKGGSQQQPWPRPGRGRMAAASAGKGEAGRSLGRERGRPSVTSVGKARAAADPAQGHSRTFTSGGLQRRTRRSEVTGVPSVEHRIRITS